jgi:hypothetical protein
VGSLDNGVCFVRPGLSQHHIHRFTSLVLFVIDGFSKRVSGTLLSTLQPCGPLRQGA